MAKPKRIFLRLECVVCKSQNYTTEKNPQSKTGKGTVPKLALRKYCKRCRKTTEHKEVKI